MSRAAEEKAGEVNWGPKDSPVCFFCEKKGHIVANCYALRDVKKSVKSVALVSTSKPGSLKSELDVFAPFLMEGMVSLPGKNNRVPVTILRDTAASQSFMVRGVLPLAEESAVGYIIVYSFYLPFYLHFPLAVKVLTHQTDTKEHKRTRPDGTSPHVTSRRLTSPHVASRLLRLGHVSHWNTPQRLQPTAKLHVRTAQA